MTVDKLLTKKASPKKTTKSTEEAPESPSKTKAKAKLVKEPTEEGKLLWYSYHDPKTKKEYGDADTATEERKYV